MGIFYADETQLIEFQKQFRKNQSALSTLQRRISDVRENLKDQKGLGLGEVKMRIGNLSTAISNMSYRMRTYDTFLQKVVENTRDAENQNTNTLQGLDFPYKESLNAAVVGAGIAGAIASKPTTPNEESPIGTAVNASVAGMTSFIKTDPVVPPKETPTESVVTPNDNAANQEHNEEPPQNNSGSTASNAGLTGYEYKGTVYDNISSVKGDQQRKYTFWGEGDSNSACFVTSIAMCLSSITGKNYTQDDMKSWCSKKFIKDVDATNLKNQTGAVQDYEIPPKKVLSMAAESITKGKPCVIKIKRSESDGGGNHYIAVTGYTPGSRYK